MFGFGSSKVAKSVEASFSPSCNALQNQVRSAIEHSKVRTKNLDETEVIAFAGWLFHFAINNSGASMSSMRKAGLELNIQANHYVINWLSSKDNIVEPERRALFEATLNKIQTRSFEYNEAFDHDKALSFDSTVSGEQMGESVIKRLISNLSTKKGDTTLMSKKWDVFQGIYRANVVETVELLRRA